MGRLPRINVKNAVYYAAPSGDNDEPIFREDSDYAMYVELLDKYKLQRGFKLFAYCLTPNNVNLLIEPSANATISQIMHDVNANYTKYFNKKYKKAGHLFKERYSIVLIEKSPNLLNIIACVHLRWNPVLRAESYLQKPGSTSILPGSTPISRNPVLSVADDILKPGSISILPGSISSGSSTSIADIAAYKYSNFSQYLNSSSDESREAIAYLNGGGYREFVEGLSREKIAEIEKELEENTIIGSEQFIRDVKSMAEKASQQQTPIPPVSQTPDSPISELKTVAKPRMYGILTSICIAVLAIAVVGLLIYIRTGQADRELAAANARYKQEAKRFEAEKADAEHELLLAKLRAAATEWIGSAKEKEALKIGKTVNTASIWAYSFRVKDMNIIRAASSSLGGYVNIDKNTYIEKGHDPDKSDTAEFLYTVITPVKLNFAYLNDRFVLLGVEYGKPTSKKKWP